MTFLFPALSLGVLLSSFAGSLHCVGMCGGLVMSVVRTRRESALYHGGRLMSYLTLGALAGLLGHGLFTSPLMHSLQLVLSLFIFLFFAWMAYQIWNQRTPHFSIIPASLLIKIQKWSLSKEPGAPLFSPAFLMGLSSGLLPCGWLHTFVIAAIASGSAPQGAMTLLFFWMGTVPALAGTGIISAKISGSLKTYSSKILAVVLLLFGTGTLLMKTYPLIKHRMTETATPNHTLAPEANTDSCPMHSDKEN